MAEIIHYLFGAMKRADVDAVESAFAQLHYNALQQRLVADCQHGLGRVAGQRSQTGAETSGHDDRLHFLISLILDKIK